MKPTLVLKAAELARHAKTLASRCNCYVVPRGTAKNPTLERHGLVKAARWHILTHSEAGEARRAVADLYVMGRAAALEIARKLSKALGRRLDVLDNTATPLDLAAHPTTTIYRNPAELSPRPGSHWKGPGGEHVKVTGVRAHRIGVISEPSGDRRMIDALEFRSVWKPVGRQVNPSRSSAARAGRKIKRQMIGGSRRIRSARSGPQRLEAMRSRSRRLTARGRHGNPKTAAQYLNAIDANVDAYYKDAISYEVFGQVQRSLWDRIKAAGLQPRVLKLLRDRHAARPSRNPAKRTIPPGKILLAEYGSFPSEDRAAVQILAEGWSDRVRSKVLLVTVSPGWEMAGSVARWTNGYHAVWFYEPSGSRHGQQYKDTDLEKARAHFDKLVTAEANPSRSAAARARRRTRRQLVPRSIRRSLGKAEKMARGGTHWRTAAAQALDLDMRRRQRSAGKPYGSLAGRSGNPKGHDPALDDAVRRIRTGLQRRGGARWSVTRGSGSVYGWIYVKSPRGDMTPDERSYLSKLLGLTGVDVVHHQGVMIPPLERDEFVARAEGKHGGARQRNPRGRKAALSHLRCSPAGSGKATGRAASRSTRNPRFFIGQRVHVQGSATPYLVQSDRGGYVLIRDEHGTVTSVGATRLVIANPKRNPKGRIPNPNRNEAQLVAERLWGTKGSPRFGGYGAAINGLGGEVMMGVVRADGTWAGYYKGKSWGPVINRAMRNTPYDGSEPSRVGNPGEKPYIVGGRRRYATLEEATAAANEIHRKTGVIASVEHRPQKTKGDPRTRSYRDIGTPAVGTITVKGTTYTVHRMSSKYTPWYLVGPRGAQFGLIRYNEKPWLFYAINASRPMSSVGKLEGVTFTGETFDQLAVFEGAGPAMNPSRSAAARRGRRTKRRAYKSRRIVRAADARARAIRAGGSGASELARFGYRMKSHETRAARHRSPNPRGHLTGPLQVGERVWVPYYGRAKQRRSEKATVIGLGPEGVHVQVSQGKRGVESRWVDPAHVRRIALSGPAGARARATALKDRLALKALRTQIRDTKKALDKARADHVCAENTAKQHQPYHPSETPSATYRSARSKLARLNREIPALEALLLDLERRDPNWEDQFAAFTNPPPLTRRVRRATAAGQFAKAQHYAARSTARGARRAKVARVARGRALYASARSSNPRLDAFTAQHLTAWLKANRPGRTREARRAIMLALRDDPGAIEAGASWPSLERRGESIRNPSGRKCGTRGGREKYRLRARGPGKSATRVPNPSALERSASVVRRFQDRGPIPVRTKRMKAPVPLSTHAAELGKLVGVIYRTDKFDGKERDYEHEFEVLPSLVTDPAGKGLHIIGGAYKITPDGIVN